MEKFESKVFEEVKEIVTNIVKDIEKIEKKYSKAAAKRIRTGLDKLAKLKVQLRKEMVEFEKGSKKD